MSKISAILTIVDQELAYKIVESIKNRTSFTNVVSADPAQIAVSGLALLYLHPAYSNAPVCYICILKKQARVATGQVRIKGEKFIKIDNFDPRKMINGLPKIFQRKAEIAFAIGYQVLSPRLSERVFETMCSLHPNHAGSIRSLYDLLYGTKTFRNTARLIDAAVERDALGLSLDIFGIDRSDVFKTWDRHASDFGKSFLNGLQEYAAYEDDIINYDVHRFPGFDSIAANDITGVVEFERADGERLTVINANRKPLERAMGVDLIYLNRRQKAFVMVQYKMMDQRSEENNDQYFNPSQGNHDSELQRLRKLKNLIAEEDVTSDLASYRFSECALFFKLCKKNQPRNEDHSLIPGMYIPLDHWELLLSDNSTLGEKGGRQLGYHTLDRRYLNKETFVGLIQSGLIGTTGTASEKIGNFIEAAIALGHSVMYAIDERQGFQGGRKRRARKRRYIENDLNSTEDEEF